MIMGSEFYLVFEMSWLWLYWLIWMIKLLVGIVCCYLKVVIRFLIICFNGLGFCLIGYKGVSCRSFCFWIGVFILVFWFIRGVLLGMNLIFR